MRLVSLILGIFAVGTCLAQQPVPKAGAPAKPADDSQIYRNTTFGFRYRIPYGWVDRTKDLQKKDENKDESSTPASKGDIGQGQVLLAVFERPPQAAGDTVNSAVVIASESASSYEGLKKAEDYLDQLDEITTAKGFKPDGDPQEVTIDSRSLVEADFLKPLNEKLTMYQSTLIMLEKSQIVTFTFIAGSKDEIDDLVEGLSFQAATSKSPAKPH